MQRTWQRGCAGSVDKPGRESDEARAHGAGHSWDCIDDVLRRANEYSTPASGNVPSGGGQRLAIGAVLALALALGLGARPPAEALARHTYIRAVAVDPPISE